MQAVRTSLVAVTIMAIVLGVIATVNARRRDEDLVALQRAKVEAAQAAADARETSAKLEAITRELDLIDAEVAAAVGVVIDAQTDGERARAKARLIELQKRQYERRRKAKRERDGDFEDSRVPTSPHRVLPA